MQMMARCFLIFHKAQYEALEMSRCTLGVSLWPLLTSTEFCIEKKVGMSKTLARSSALSLECFRDSANFIIWAITGARIVRWWVSSRVEKLSVLVRDKRAFYVTWDIKNSHFHSAYGSGVKTHHMTDFRKSERTYLMNLAAFSSSNYWRRERSAP